MFGCREDELWRGSVKCIDCFCVTFICVGAQSTEVLTVPLETFLSFVFLLFCRRFDRQEQETTSTDQFNLENSTQHNTQVQFWFGELLHVKLPTMQTKEKDEEYP